MERGKTKYPGVTFRQKRRFAGQPLERCYYIRYYCNSKRVEEPVGWESEGMTAAKANQIRALRASGKELSNTATRKAEEIKKLQAGGAWTIGRLWEYYYKTIENNNYAKMNVSTSKHLHHLFNKNVADLTTQDVDDLSRKLFRTPAQTHPDKTLSAQSVKHVLALLKRMVRLAAQRGLCPYPQGLHFTMPVLDNIKTESMTQEQMQAYFAALDEEPDQRAAAYLRICLLTGIRKTALLSLLWSDIDFENARITLRGETAKKGKTEHIPLTNSVREILLSLPRSENSPYIFPGKNGGRRGEYRKVAERVRDKAGLPKDFRPIHGLRHSYASFLASSGKVDLYTLQKLLTHGSPQMTQRYAHLADEALQRAASVAEGMLTPLSKQ